MGVRERRQPPCKLEGPVRLERPMTRERRPKKKQEPRDNTELKEAELGGIEAAQLLEVSRCH